MVNKSNTNTINCDVIVIGAGLIGLASVIALTVQGKRAVLVDAKPKPKRTTLSKAWDTRIYALTPSTVSWLSDLGIWALVDQARVRDVERMALWAPETLLPLQLHASDANLSELACIIENQNLMRALWQYIETLDSPMYMDNACQHIEYSDDAITVQLDTGCHLSAKLLIAADGANSYVRQALGIATNIKAFNQTALVANYQAEKSHDNVAMQWFRPHETLAMLPMPDKYVSMVWAMSTNKAQELLLLTSGALATKVQQACDNELGRLEPMSDTLSFELRQAITTKQIAERVAFVGDAAHQVHPMAGQGANLGFRDIITLEKIMKNSHPLQDIGEDGFLRQFARARKADIISMSTLTSGLDKLFAHESNALKALVSASMQQLDKYATIKRILIKQAVA
ncbi:MAG: FAD-dependent monooxygenase [Methylophilaceae bacterium]